MSMPNIPDITPKIEINREEAITMLLASIALEEMGLAHILNAEGEKVQRLLEDKNVCTYDLLAVNESVEQVIKSITKLQLLLQEKLDTVVRLLPKDYEPCPGPKPPQPRPKCVLMGSGVATVQNRDDDFFGSTATLETKRQNKYDDDQYPFTYTLFKRGKGTNLSAVLVPIPAKFKVECGKKLAPCPTPEQPNFLAMQGKAIMCVQINSEKHQATVNFHLKVWDYGLRKSLQMITWGESEIYAHDSGVMELSQGDLRIKPLSK